MPRPARRQRVRLPRTLLCRTRDRIHRHRIARLRRGAGRRPVPIGTAAFGESRRDPEVPAAGRDSPMGRGLRFRQVDSKPSGYSREPIRAKRHSAAPWPQGRKGQTGILACIAPQFTAARDPAQTKDEATASTSSCRTGAPKASPHMTPRSGAGTNVLRQARQWRLLFRTRWHKDREPAHEVLGRFG